MGLPFRRVVAPTGWVLAAIGGSTLSGMASATSPPNLPIVRVVSAENVSGVSPWRQAHCNSASTKPGFENTWALAEPFMAEPIVAVNPRTPENRIIAWQDRFRGTINTAFTVDSGRTWRLSRPVGFDNCTGDFRKPWQGAADVWLSFGPSARAYLSALSFTDFSPVATPQYTEVTRVAISMDGGADWQAAITVPNALQADDKDLVLADETRPEVVYIASRNTGFGMPIGKRGAGELLFSRSTDGGRHFTSRIVDQTGSENDTFGNPLLAEFADGTLLYTYEVGLIGPIVARQSLNGGQTWSAAVPVSGPPGDLSFKACGSSVVLRGDSSQIAVFGQRQAVLAYAIRSRSGAYELMLSHSDDAGRTWNTWRTLTSRLPIGIPSVAADGRGAIAVVYDQIDIHGIACGTNPPNPVIPARTTVAVSTDGGHEWKSATVGAKWWNFAAGGIIPFFDGYWVGDYQAIASTPQGFITATPQGPALSGKEPTGGITGDMSIVAGEVAVISRQ